MIKSREEMYEHFLRITENPTDREKIILDVLSHAAYHLNDEGEHVYFGTYCHHENHGACKKVCKTCSSPCVCHCHEDEKFESVDCGV